MVNSASCKHGRDGGVGKFLLCFGLTFLIDVEYQGTHITLTVGMGPCTRMALLVRYAPKTDRVVAVRSTVPAGGGERVVRERHSSVSSNLTVRAVKLSHLIG